MRPADEHLTPQELKSLLFAATDPDVPIADGEAAQSAMQHLDGCAACQQMARKHFNADAALETLRTWGRRASQLAPSTPECPADEIWLRIAAGLAGDAAAFQYITHAAQCDRCGRLLQESTEDLAQDLTPEEQTAISQLPSASEAWQRRMAKKLAAQNPFASTVAREPARARSEAPKLKKEKRPVWSPRFAFAMASLAVVAVAGWMVWQKVSKPDANLLLSQAYTERRTMELRISGVRYAPLRLQRGSEQSLLSRPAPLLKAEELIATRLALHPADPFWLQAKGRADLLDGNHAAAIDSLQRALEIVPDSPQLLTDLATAYFEQAEHSGDVKSYGRAIELLGEALVKAPDDPVALFNQAIACERFSLYTQAIDDWNHYLRVDPDGPWADDARERLAKLRAKLKKHEQSVLEPLLSPSSVARLAAHDAGLRKKINDRLEDYFLVASLDWLPKAYPVHGNSSSVDYQTALRILAEIASEEHDDLWWTDVLSATSSGSVPRALGELSRAIEENDRGDNVAARRDAQDAYDRFRAGGNQAGALRARVEYLFASHDAQQGRPCLDSARGLERDLRSRPYRWLIIQFHIEQGTCYGLVGDLDKAARLYGEAAQEAQASGYRQIYLRTQDHLAGLSGATGRLQAGWAVAQRGLTLFWDGNVPGMRGYNFYYNLYEFSRITKQPHLQMAAWRDALALSDSFRDNVMRAMAHSDMASAAAAAQQFQTAEQEFTRASQLFGDSPPIKSTRIALIEAETRLAEIEVAQGRATAALARLRNMEPEVAELSDSSLPILFYTTLGEAESRVGDSRKAESALRSAISFSELKMSSLRDESSRIQWSEQASAPYRRLVQLKLLQGDSYAALEIWEWYRGAAQRMRRNEEHLNSEALVQPAGASLLQPHAVASWLPNLDHETVIAYALLPDGLATWVFDNRGVSARWIEIEPAKLEARVARFRSLCADPQSEESNFRRNARSLYELLIAPINERLSPERTLLIEADETLSQIAFDALMDAHGRFLADRFSITASLGSYYHRRTRVAVPITRDSYAVVAVVPIPDTVLGSPLATLPDAAEEADMVANTFRGARVFSGKAATVDSVRSQLAHAQIFHFAGHAIALPQRTGLLLSDSLMDAASLKGAPLSKLQLAVFSACDTQDGSAGGVYDPDGLVRIFLSAGVPYVVASRWNVDSDATRQFMQLFYRDVLAGNSVPESIRRAQAELRSRPNRTHPYYWSAFTSFGTL